MSRVSVLPDGYGMGTEPKYRGAKQTRDREVTILWDTDDVGCPPDNYTSLLFLNALHEVWRAGDVNAPRVCQCRLFHSYTDMCTCRYLYRSPTGRSPGWCWSTTTSDLSTCLLRLSRCAPTYRRSLSSFWAVKAPPSKRWRMYEFVLCFAACTCSHRLVLNGRECWLAGDTEDSGQGAAKEHDRADQCSRCISRCVCMRSPAWHLCGEALQYIWAFPFCKREQCTLDVQPQTISQGKEHRRCSTCFIIAYEYIFHDPSTHHNIVLNH